MLEGRENTEFPVFAEEAEDATVDPDEVVVVNVDDRDERDREEQ